MISEERKKAIKTFKRRYGHYFIGVFILLCVIFITYIGWYGGLEYTPLYRKFTADSSKSNTGGDMFGFDSMGLSFDVTVAGFDGESFIYSIYFNRDISAGDITEINRRINSECEKYTEDVYFGYISGAEKAESNMAQVMLDLGNADNEDMITGLVKSLDGMDGIEKVIINEDLEY